MRQDPPGLDDLFDLDKIFPEFKPCFYTCPYTGSVTAYWAQDPCSGEPLNGCIEVLRSIETGQLVGIKLYGVWSRFPLGRLAMRLHRWWRRQHMRLWRYEQNLTCLLKGHAQNYYHGDGYCGWCGKSKG